MATCFVIQPFDAGRFDKLYVDVFEPAIRAAGLEPYRVDQDPSASIPIQDIERGIKRAAVCLAEITTDNPNVWYELGFAFATGVPVVMVCCETRTRFPFDVQHRSIVIYKTESASDFAILGERIDARLRAEIERVARLEDVSDISPLTQSDGLSPHEMTALVSIAGYSALSEDPPSPWTIRQDMTQAGFNDVAVTLATRSLEKKGLVQTARVTDERGSEYSGISITEQGFDWLEANLDRLVLRRNAASVSGDTEVQDDSLPF